VAVYRNFLKALGILVLFTTCSKERYTSWDIDVLAPLAEAELGMKNIIADSILTDEEGMPLMCRFNKVIGLFPSDSVFRIPDTTIRASYQLPLPLTLPAGFQIYNANEMIRFALGNTRITEVSIAEGTTIFTAQSFINEKLFFDYSIPKAYNPSGQSLRYENIKVDSAQTDNASSIQLTTDLKGFRLNLKGDQDNQFNRLRVSLNARINPEGNGVPVQGNKELLKYSYSFIGLKPFFAKGYMGNPQFENQDSLDFQFLRKFEGFIEPEEARLNMHIENGIGADLGIELLEFRARNTRTGANLPLSHPVVGKRQYVSRASNTPRQGRPYTAGNKEIDIRSSNSNLKSLISILPDQFHYRARIQINPMGDLSSGNDFIYSSSQVNVRLLGEIPLKLDVRSLQFTDTIALEGIQAEQTDQIQSGGFTILAVNGFPFEMMASISLLDENRQFIRAFLAGDTIQAAGVDAENRVNQPVQTRLRIPYKPAMKSQLERTRFVVLRARISSKPENTYLPVFPNYTLKLSLIGDGIYRIKFK